MNHPFKTGTISDSVCRLQWLQRFKLILVCIISCGLHISVEGIICNYYHAMIADRINSY